MTGVLIAVAVLGGVLLMAMTIALAGGWRPGGRSRPTAETVQEQVRRELALPAADWRTVRRAVQRGRAAPEPLRPAAYELARRLQAVREAGVLHRHPRLVTGVAVAYGLAVVAVVVLREDGPWWDRALPLWPGVLYAVLIRHVVRRQAARARTALTANAPDPAG